MVNQCIAIQQEDLLVQVDATNELSLHCDQCNICGHVACNPLTILVAMVALHLEFEPMNLVAVAIVMYLLTSSFKKKYR